MKTGRRVDSTGQKSACLVRETGVEYDRTVGTPCALIPVTGFTSKHRNKTRKLFIMAETMVLRLPYIASCEITYGKCSLSKDVLSEQINVIAT